MPHMPGSIAADAAGTGDDLDPDIRRFIRSTQAAWARHPALASVSSAEARAIAERVRAPWAAGGPIMARTTDMTVAVRGTNVGVRLYAPRSQPGSQPALVYLHGGGWTLFRSEEQTSELQSLMRTSHAVFCSKKKKT